MKDDNKEDKEDKEDKRINCKKAVNNLN